LLPLHELRKHERVQLADRSRWSGVRGGTKGIALVSLAFFGSGSVRRPAQPTSGLRPALNETTRVKRWPTRGVAKVARSNYWRRTSGGARRCVWEECRSTPERCKQETDTSLPPSGCSPSTRHCSSRRSRAPEWFSSRILGPRARGCFVN